MRGISALKMRTPSHRSGIVAAAIAILLTFVSSVAGDGTRNRATEQVKPSIEEQLRQHLRKLRGWGISQLMRTEQKVDNEQKRRANTSSNPRELALLAQDEDVGVRFLVAVNRYTPIGTLIGLASDPKPTVRSGVALSLAYDPLDSESVRQVVEDLGIRLARDEQVLVRLGLLTNDRLPERVFETLSADADFMVRTKLAEHHLAPQRVLMDLAQDSVYTVRATALRHRNLPPDWLRQASGDPLPLIRMSVTSNVNTPLSVLDSLASDPDPGVRLLLAKHQRTRLATLRRMSGDPEVDVILAVANHPTADRALLTKLAFEAEEGAVRSTAQRRLEPLLRKEIREDILERWNSD